MLDACGCIDPTWLRSLKNQRVASVFRVPLHFSSTSFQIILKRIDVPIDFGFIKATRREAMGRRANRCAVHVALNMEFAELLSHRGLHESRHVLRFGALVSIALSVNSGAKNLFDGSTISCFRAKLPSPLPSQSYQSPALTPQSQTRSRACCPLAQ